MISVYSSGDLISKGAVGRAIFQSSDWHKMERGTTSISIFLDTKSPTKISVFLLNLTSDDELTQIGDGIAKQRGVNRKFYGWAELSVTDANRDQRKVHFSPQPENAWHADIVLPPIAETDKKERERHANELANKAILRARGGG